jgi:hypothetical protein
MHEIRRREEKKGIETFPNPILTPPTSLSWRTLSRWKRAAGSLCRIGGRPPSWSMPAGSDLRSCVSPPLELRSRPCKRNRNHGTASASRPTFLFGPRHVVHWLRWQLPSFPATSQRGPTDGSCSPGTAASSLARHSLPAEPLVVLASARGPMGSETSFSALSACGQRSHRSFSTLAGDGDDGNFLPSPSQLPNHLVKSHSTYTGSRLPQQQNPRRSGLARPLGDVSFGATVTRHLHSSS